MTRPLTFAHAIDRFVTDMQGEGRINSPSSVTAYRHTLNRHCDDVHDLHPSMTDREDVKRTLARWPNPNSRRKRRSMLISFYDWAMEEGLRTDNPARQTRRPKGRPVNVYRLDRSEVVAFLQAAETTRERRIAYLGICAGLRNAELRGLTGGHFQRPGYVHVSADIAKGGRERWVPVLAELAPIVIEIRAAIDDDHFVLPASRFSNPGINTRRLEFPTKPSSSQALGRAVEGLAVRAGIRAHIHPHLMRHAFGDHVTRHAGMRNAQTLLGHADVATTQLYTGAPTLDELTAAVGQFRFGVTLAP